MRITVTALLIGSAFLTSVAHADVTEDLRNCPRTEDSIAAEAACTRVVTAAELPTAQRAMAYVYRGDTFRLRRDFERALADYKAAVALDAANAAAHHNMGYVLEELQRPSEAIDAYSRALQARPDDASTLANRAASYFQLGRFDEAIADYTRAITQDPSDAANFEYRALAYLEMGDREKALGDLAAAARLAPNNGDLLVKKAQILHRLERWEEVVASATEAISRSPTKLAEAFNARGDALGQMAAYDDAVADLTEAMRLNPSMMVTYINRAGVYEKMGRDDLARGDYETAARRFPSWFIAHRKLAEFFTERGDHANAVISLTRAIEAAPEDAKRWALRAEVYADARRTLEAIADYSRALQLSPAVAEWHFARGKLYQAVGDTTAALADLDESIRLVPRSASYHRLRAELHRANGDREAAAADEERAEEVSDGPTSGQFLFFLVLGLLLSGSVAVGLGAAVLIPDVLASATVAAVGAVAYSLWPLRDILVEPDAYLLLDIALAALAGLIWWLIGRGLRAAAFGEPRLIRR